MKASTWFFLLLTFGLFAAGAAVLRTGRDSPEVTFQSVQLEIARGRLSVEQILDDLDDALTYAEQAGDGATATEIRRARGGLFLELGAHDEARRDFEMVLDVVGRDYDVEGLLVELEKRAGNLESAMARVERRLENDPSQGEVWVQAASVYVLAGDEHIEECLESLSRVLVTADEERAAKLLERGAALDPSDPLRVAVGHDLWQLFASDTESRRQEALAAMDTASEYFARARRAYSHSLELTPDPDAVAGLLDLLARAAQDHETLDLGIASLPYNAVRETPETALILIRTLREAGQLPFAAEFATGWAFSEEIVPLPELYAECCRTLMEHESWGPLINAANRLGQSTNPRLAPHAQLYRGIGLAHRSDYTRARQYLADWLKEVRTEPFPGAVTVAWQNVARCWEELDQPELERLALEQAVEAGATFEGETWLHLAELQLEARHGGYRTPEERWARGMAMSDPVSDELASERFERWKEMGERELQTTAFDPEAEHRNMVRTETWNPRPGLSPYELFRLAQEHEKAGDEERALTTHRHLLEDVPGFPPSIDRSIELAMDLGYERDAAELLLERMKRTGRDAYALEVIDELDLQVLEREDLLLLMRLDPESTGRRRIALSYHADGHPERAVDVLGDLADEELAPELRAYGIELLARLGRFDEVATLLARIDAQSKEDTGLGPEHMVTMIDVYVGAQRAERVHETVELMLRARSPRKDTWLRAIDRLLDGGYVAQADRLLQHLEAKPSTTGGDVLVRAAIASLLSDDPDSALRFATRAQAFPTGGVAELMDLVVLVELERYGDLRVAVDHLRATDYATSPYQDFALLLLEDDLPRARVAIEAEEETLQRDPLWMLLSCALGALDGEAVECPAYYGESAGAETERLVHGRAGDEGAPRHDPRRLAALLLALEDPVAGQWARGALADLDPTGAALWPTYLSHSSRREPRARPALRAAMEGLTERYPRFGPAWDRLIELTRRTADQRESTELIELRVRRFRALGEELATPLELALDRAREAWVAEQPRRAAQFAREAAEIDPGSLDAHRIVASLHALAGRFDVAVPAYDAALRLVEPAPNLVLVSDALGVYSRARQRGDLDLEGHGARLQELSERFPDDPAVPLARAEFELVSDMKNPALGVARAYAHLDRFRQDHARRSLEDLRAGSSVRWGRFLLSLDPQRAQQFAQEELLAKPGSLELWIFMGEILQSSGDLPGALQHMLVVNRMAPRDGRALRKLAELEARNGIGRVLLSRRIQQVRTALHLKDTDPELAYWRAMAIMGAGSRGIVGSLDRLGRVWRNRFDLPSYLALERVGLRYSAALIARGGEEDRQLAREVLTEFQDTVADPYQRDLTAALFGLSLHDSTPSSN